MCTQVSEISLFFVARAQHLQLIQRHHYLVSVATTVILMVASPVVIKALQKFSGFSGNGSGNGGSIESLNDRNNSIHSGLALLEGGGGGGGGGWLSPVKMSVKTGKKKREDERRGESREYTQEGSGLGLALGGGGGSGAGGRDEESARPVAPAGASEGGGKTRRRVLVV